jgi:parvulin-like peptidyl-prolyl isomerase
VGIVASDTPPPVLRGAPRTATLPPSMEREGGHDEVRQTEDPAPRGRIWLLALGAGLGLAAAASGLIVPAPGTRGALPDDAVARVNGTIIQQSDYDRLLAGLASDKRNPIDDASRRHVLDRMIDEELLVQRGLDLGLAHYDRRVRANLTGNLLDSIVSTAEQREPEPDALRKFYAEQRDFFARPGRFHVRQVFIRIPLGGDEDALRARAAEAVAALRDGAAFEAVAAEYGDQQISPLPDAELPALKLREYIGPTGLDHVLALQVGETSQAVRSGAGLHIFRLVSMRPPSVPPFAEIEAQVRSEWRRRTGDRALRAYLDQLREEADIVTRPQP